MAFVQEEDVSPLQRVASGISGAFKGVGTVMDWMERRQQAQAQQQLLLEHAKYFQQETEQKAQQLQDVYSNKAGSLLFNTLTSSDPKQAWGLYKNDYLNYAQRAGHPADPAAIETMVQNLTPEIQKEAGIFKQNVNTVYGATGGMTDPKDFGSAVKAGRTSLTNLLGLVPEAVKPQLQHELDKFDQATEKSASRLTQWEEAKAKMTQAQAIRESQQNLKLEKEARDDLNNTAGVITGTASRGAQSMIAQWAKRSELGGLMENMFSALDDPSKKPEDRLVATKQFALQVARNYDSLVSMGSSSADLAQKLVPTSWKGTAKDFWQQVSGNPETYLTPGNLKQMQGEVKVERDTMNKFINNMVTSNYNRINKQYGKDAADTLKQAVTDRFQGEGILNPNTLSLGGASPNQQPAEVTMKDPKTGKLYVVDPVSKKVLREAQ